MPSMRSPLLTLLLCLAACSEPAHTPETRSSTPATALHDEGAHAMTTSPSEESLATFGAGCFWCVEAVLEQLDGVLDVTSGYMGGEVDRPSYKEVCSGTTGHAEVVQVRYDPARVSYGTLLEWFFQLHDPTTPDRQGADVGTQYRSAIFYHSPEQRQEAEAAIRKLEADHAFAAPIVTEVSAATTFWPAEGYHQDYYRLNKEQGYCRAVIAPKLGKLGLAR